MKRFRLSSILSIALVILTLFFVVSFPETVRADEQSGFINVDYVNFRSGPGIDKPTIDDIQFRKNTHITVIGEAVDSQGNLWYQITYNNYTGYVSAEFVTIDQQAPVSDDTDFEAQISVFPDSYKPGLRQLHNLYPGYTFVPDFINESFSSWVNREWPNKVLYYDVTFNSWLAMTDDNYDWNTGTWIRPSSEWSTISYETCAYYMDPRNFFNSTDVYMFLRQVYSEDQTVENIKKILKDTFMETNYTPKKGDADDEKYKGDYAEVILAAARESGVSAYFIATNIIGEQGINGSPLCNGKYPGYEGYYNFYNYDAWGSNNTEVIVRGLVYAKKMGWDSVYKCIVDGARIFAEGYINNNQDTFFYKDYNLLGVGGVSHQYAGAASAPQIHSNTLSSYLSTERELKLSFRIPVYAEMPTGISNAPARVNRNNNYYITDTTADLSEAFNMFVFDHSMSVSKDTSFDIFVPEGAEYTGNTEFALSPGANKVELPVRAETGYYRTYTITVNASDSCKLTVNVKNTEFNKQQEDPNDNNPGDNNNGNSGENNGDSLFTDMTDPSVSYYRPVYWAASKDYIRGFSDGSFRPDDNCTRGQFAIILWRLAGRPAPESDYNPFSDVSSSDSYYKAILWAVENDIIRGYDDGTFRPDNTVTRLNVVIMLWRLAGRPQTDTEDSVFPDVNSSMSGFKAVAWGESTGVIRGANGYFLPEDNCTRAQIVIFFYRYVRDILGEDVSIN